MNFPTAAVFPGRPTVIGLGEMLWDCFPDGRRPGGAPANVAYHANLLGMDGLVATQVGNDTLGHALLHFLTDNGLSTGLVQQSESAPTGTVTVQIDSTGSASYVFLENSAWDSLVPGPSLLAAAATASAIVFGTLAQRSPVSRAGIHQVLLAAAPDTLRLYDVNLRPPFFSQGVIQQSLGLATAVKLNSDELATLVQMFEIPSRGDVDSQLEALASWIFHNYPQCNVLAVTCGADGSRVVTRTDQILRPGEAISVVDTVGAGDAFTAGLVYGLLAGWPIAQTATLANRMGGLVASHAGAMPAIGDQVQELLHETVRGATTPSQSL